MKAKETWLYSRVMWLPGTFSRLADRLLTQEMLRDFFNKRTRTRKESEINPPTTEQNSNRASVQTPMQMKSLAKYASNITRVRANIINSPSDPFYRGLTEILPGSGSASFFAHDK